MTTIHGAYETVNDRLIRVGKSQVHITGYKLGPINGRMEILYNRRNGWIRDARIPT